MKIIFCAGADRNGKTTLTDEFIRHGYTYKHFGPPSGSPYEEYKAFLDDLMRNGKSNDKWIVDRFMYCEFPYSKHYGRETDMNFEKMRELEDKILQMDPNSRIVYCCTDLYSNWQRIKEEGKNEFSNISQLISLRKEYERVWRNSKIRVINYDFTMGDCPEDVVGKIENGNS